MDGNQTRTNDTQFISFQDFPSINHEGNSNQAQLNVNTSTHQGFSNLPNDPTGIGIIDDLEGMPDKNEATSSHSFWTIEYYQKYFNVNTKDVVERIKRSMVPHGTENYLISHIRPNPDLYGPFWICVTLIFAIAISGNLANYLQTVNVSKYHWRYEFHLVSYAATCIFLYAWLLPLLLWGILKWTNSTRNTDEELIDSYAAPSILELLCLYGYSLAIYIPIAFLLTIQIAWIQWCLVVISTFLSGGVLLRSLLPIIAGKYKIIYMVAILGMHLLLAAGFMHYFFHNVPLEAIDLAQHVAPTVHAQGIVNNVSNSVSAG
ncbi:protein YIPF1 [Ceratina calcarata]|uniref:Protein YIPF n=1 Tax=Ceratina calcarata TaxID=156304 RepID=A0AAJ7N9Y5_9HYME|nr:protein YIPF1 [Ceratina calcarata]